MKSRQIITTAARIVLGCVFIFSGFVKAVDPWGGAIKFGEYFAAFGVDWVGERLSFVLAIGLSTLEMGLGLMLIFGLWLRKVSVVTLGFTSFFTLFTFYIALTNPVADCGCFGEVWKITNWQTFFKNALFLLPLSGLVWYDVGSRKVRDRQNIQNFLLVVLVTLVPALVSIWSLTHLPLVDFLPYRVGTNLRAGSLNELATDEQTETELIYRDKTTGKEHRFLLSDTTWYDESRWEYVDTKVVDGNSKNYSSSSFFSLYNALGDDITQEFLEQKHVYLLCLSSGETKQTEKLQQFISRKSTLPDNQVVVITPASISDETIKLFDCQYFNIDATALKTLIRAKVGVVELRDGVIVGKVNWRDVDKL